MASIDVRHYNLKYWMDGDDTPLATQVSLPQCSSWFTLRGGPTLTQIAMHFAVKVPYEVSCSAGLFKTNGENEQLEVAEKLPLEFKTAESGPVGVIVSSIDLNPDSKAYLLAIKGGNAKHSTGIGLKGWLVHFERGKPINQLQLKKCLVFYRPEEHQGCVGIIADDHPIPGTQVISGVESLAQIVISHFCGGFVEVYAPDRKSRWGRVSGFSSAIGEAYVSALRNSLGEWKFNRVGYSGLGLMVFGRTLYDLGGSTSKLPGDVILCSDGTILCSYYYSVSAELKRRKEEGFGGFLPDTDVDGHYFTRFYSPTSTLVPVEVIESFNREMPEWYRTTLLLAKEKTQS